MKTNQAIVTVLRNVRKHPDADKLQLASVVGTQIVVGLDAKEGDIGIYFDCNLQLSEEFARGNDLVRRKDVNGKPAGGFFEENRRVRAIKLRGERSDGFFCPLDYLEKAYCAAHELDFFPMDQGLKHWSSFEEGDQFDTFEGVPICNKYIFKKKGKRGQSSGQKKEKFGDTIRMFKQHGDTPQLGHNLRMLEQLDDKELIVITEKLHGTSQRTGYMEIPVPYKLNWAQRALMNLIDTRSGIEYGKEMETYKYDLVTGTRRTVLNPDRNTAGYYSDTFRRKAAEPFKFLRKGETAYYEVVGWDSETGNSIMPVCDNTKLGKTFVKKYGTKTTFRYGAEEGNFKIFVYKITVTNEDGEAVALSWKDTKKRCVDLGVDHVPELFVGTFKELKRMMLEDNATFKEFDMPEEVYPDLAAYIDTNYATGPSELDSHLREGAVIRIEGGLDFDVYKHKNFEFKVLENIIKDHQVDPEDEC